MHADDFFSLLGATQEGGSAPQAPLQPVLPQSKSNYCKFYATKHGNSILPFFFLLFFFFFSFSHNLIPDFVAIPL